MRDTDQDWKEYGEFQPFFGVLAHEKFLRENLSEETLTEFWQSGNVDIEATWNRAIALFGPRKSVSAVDFGCGVGRLARAMAQIADTVTGVDVSPGMLAEAARHDPPANLRLTHDIPDEKFDWINSFIVFQHIPPERGYVLFEELLRRAADTCLLTVQFTFFKSQEGLANQGLNAMKFGTWDGNVIRPLLRETLGRTMMMYDYDMNRIYAMLIAHGFVQTYMVHTDHGGAHGAHIIAAR